MKVIWNVMTALDYREINHSHNKRGHVQSFFMYGDDDDLL